MAKSNKKNESPIYRIMKVFDCQWDPGMPKDVKEGFFRIFKGRGNDIFVEYAINNERFDPEDEDSEWAQDKKRLDAWLLSNGAESPKDEDSEGEEVLIKHWW